MSKFFKFLNMVNSRKSDPSPPDCAVNINPLEDQLAKASCWNFRFIWS